VTLPDREPYLPHALADSVAHWEDDTAALWLAELPARLGRLAVRWDLEIGEPFDPGGVTAWVAPVTTRGEPAVVKVVIPHREARDEAPALRAWSGLGAPHLIDDAPDEHALLMEQCAPGTPLCDVDDPETIVDVGAEVLSRLWRADTDGHGFEPLTAIGDWFADLVEERRDRFGAVTPVDPDLTRLAIDHLRTLPRTADRQVLLHHDLHPGNILFDEGRGWLAIDPKPQVGDPAFDPVQLVLQSSDPLDDADPSRTVRRRVERLAVLLELDPDRLAAWGLARCIEWAHNGLALGDSDRAARHARRAALFAAV
jgi:streptomycin 6-kinase